MPSPIIPSRVSIRMPISRMMLGDLSIGWEWRSMWPVTVCPNRKSKGLLLALFCHPGMSAFLTLWGAQRTSRAHRQNVAPDPNRTFAAADIDADKRTIAQSCFLSFVSFASSRSDEAGTRPDHTIWHAVARNLRRNKARSRGHVMNSQCGFPRTT
jgi:hypothetical protein